MIIKSIVTETYESDPATHRVTAAHTRTGAQVFDDLYASLSSLGILPAEYFIPDNEARFQATLPEDCHFSAHADFGESEGIYLDIICESDSPARFAVGKTLEDSANEFLRMSEIAATAQLLLNGNGREYDLTLTHSYPMPQQSRKEGCKTIYVCSPLAGEIESNIRKAREYSRFVASQGAIPIAPHITELFNDLVPEEREMGLAMGIEYLRKADELWVFGSRISDGMAAEIALAQKALDIPIYHVGAPPYEPKPLEQFLSEQSSKEHTQASLLSQRLQSCAQKADKQNGARSERSGLHGPAKE